MLSFGLTLIITVCLSVLCVYASNIKPLIHHRIKKAVIYHAEGHKDLSNHTGIGRVYQNPRIKSNARPLKADTWTVGIAGHA
jgi:hypothetical protein